MIGYIFLITVTIVISTIVFQQLKTYVPTETLECPEGVSVFLKETTYDCVNKELNITLRNNGRFSVAGYFITATDDPGKKLATIDLSKYTELGKNRGGIVLFDFLSENSMGPNKEMKNVFNLSNSSVSQFYSLSIIPIRYQEIENRNRIVSCSEARVEETLSCIGACVQNTCAGLGYSCGEWDNGCEGTLDCNQPGCSAEESCDASGQCISSACVPAADPSKLGVCGSFDCGIHSNLNGTCGDVNCGECVNGNCDIPTGQCILEEITEGVVFVSSAKYNGGDLGGINGADAKCNSLASTAGLTGTFVAWLSNSTLDAKDRVLDIPFEKLDGVVIANNLADLLDGTIDSKINVNENNAVQGEEKHVFTGTLTDGTKASDNCNDWSSNSNKGQRGKLDQTNNKWVSENAGDCDHTSRLYCFQVS